MKSVRENLVRIVLIMTFCNVLDIEASFGRNSDLRGLLAFKARLLLMKVPLLLAKLEMFSGGHRARDDNLSLEEIKGLLREGLPESPRMKTSRTSTSDNRSGNERALDMIDSTAFANVRKRPLSLERRFTMEMSRLADDFMDMMSAEDRLSPRQRSQRPRMSKARLAMVKEKVMSSVNEKIKRAAIFLDSCLNENERKVIRFMPASSVSSLLDSLPERDYGKEIERSYQRRDEDLDEFY